MNAKQKLDKIIGEELASRWIGMVQDGLQLHRDYNLARTEFYKDPSIENEKVMDDLYKKLYGQEQWVANI